MRFHLYDGKREKPVAESNFLRDLDYNIDSLKRADRSEAYVYDKRLDVRLTLKEVLKRGF